MYSSRLPLVKTKRKTFFCFRVNPGLEETGAESFFLSFFHISSVGMHCGDDVRATCSVGGGSYIHYINL